VPVDMDKKSRREWSTSFLLLAKHPAQNGSMIKPFVVYGLRQERSAYLLLNLAFPHALSQACSGTYDFLKEI